MEMVGTAHIVGVDGRVPGTVQPAVCRTAPGPAELEVAFRARHVHAVRVEDT